MAMPSHPIPAPLLIEGEECYLVYQLLAHTWYHGGLQFLVHWAGASIIDDTWEPGEDLQRFWTIT